MRPQTLLFVFLFCFSAFTERLEAQGAGSPPNIIFILADDVGQECIGTYGGTSYRTPNLDSMASRGMKFNRAYSLPSCTPTRSKALTGRSNVRNYVYFSYLDPAEKIFSEYLQLNGYSTLAAGKWQLCGSYLYPEFLGGKHPSNSGFDEWFLWQVDSFGPRYWDPYIESYNAPPTTYYGEYGPDVINDYILDFIGRNKNNPFMVYYPMLLSHTPFSKPPNYKGGTNSALEVFPYLIEYMDELVGRIFKKLKAEGLLENTLVVFAGDNGTYEEIVSEWPHHSPTGLVRGSKGGVREHGLRMPMIAYWKDTINSGQVNNELIDYSDLFPTFLELAGVDIPNDRIIDGVSFAGQLNGNQHKTRDFIYNWYWPKPDKLSAPKRWIITEKYKLYGHNEFYDISVDPLETNNLIFSSDPNIQAELARHRAWLANYPKISPYWGG